MNEAGSASGEDVGDNVGSKASKAAGPATHNDARLIALDWGTSSLRAMLLGRDGQLLEQRDVPRGIMQVADRDFAGVFEATVAGWRAAAPDLPAIAAGMIGSAQGWREAPYRRGLTGAAELAQALVTVPLERGRDLHIVPGVALTEPQPEVIRGEETQVIGALALHPDLARGARLVLPGTHSKWIDVAAGRIGACRTFMTGELFAVLRQHSILGRLFAAAREQGGDGLDAFDAGVAAARESREGVAPLLFSARAKVLLGQLRDVDSLEYLSGLLIGDEIRAGLDGALDRVTLIGDAKLCERYRRALRQSGVERIDEIQDTARVGLWRIAVEAGLVA